MYKVIVNRLTLEDILWRTYIQFIDLGSSESNLLEV